MRRIIHTFILAFQFIILPAVFTACKDDGGNISPLQEVTPAFSWEENSFLLETDNGWGITRFSNRIALSNFSQKRQYHLSWNGGSGAGEKTSGVLRIAEAGKKLQTILLDKLYTDYLSIRKLVEQESAGFQTIAVEIDEIPLPVVFNNIGGIWHKIKPQKRYGIVSIQSVQIPVYSISDRFDS
mgnify:CR=1 FL=1